MSNEMKCTFSSGPILRCSIYLSDSYFVATLALIRFGWKDIFLFLLFVLFGVYLSISHTKLWYLSTSLGWFPAANCQWFIDLFVWCVYFLYLSLSPTLRSYISLQLSCFFFCLYISFFCSVYCLARKTNSIVERPLTPRWSRFHMLCVKCSVK